MPEQLWFTALLNRLFAGPVDSILRALGIQPLHPQAPITDFVAMQILVAAFLILFFALVRSRLSADHPGGLQHIVEGAEAFIKDQSHQVIGPHSEGYTAFLVALGFFILICNLIGMIPGFDSPTAPGLRAGGFLLLPRAGPQKKRRWLRQALCRALLVDGSADVSH
jgi:F-type H+-transporting ATPase subunit a